MKEREMTVINEVGLHARPSLRITEIARRNPHTKVILKNSSNGLEADAMSILSLLSLGLIGGSKVVVSASGQDEEIVLKEIAEVLETFKLET